MKPDTAACSDGSAISVAVVADRPDEEVLAVGEHRREHGDNMAHDDLARHEMPLQRLSRILERELLYLNLGRHALEGTRRADAA